MSKYFLALVFSTGCGFLSKSEEENEEDGSEATAEDEEVNYSTEHECPFTPISGTKMSSYDCNPVFESTGESWADELGSFGFYSSPETGHMMWYTSYPEDQPYGMGLATSANGSEWTVSVENPLLQEETGAWDQDSLSGQTIVWDEIESEYLMLYQGFNLSDNIWGMGVATSPDGIIWTKSEANPVINFTEEFDLFSGFSPCWPLTLTADERGVLRGYIAVSAVDFEGGESKCEIYAMSGLSATDWVIDTNSPVMEAGSSYDSKGFSGASIVEFEGVLYMFYIGFSEWVQYDGYQTVSNPSLNLATSTNGGETWTRDSNNPLPITAPQSIGAQRVNERIHLWVKKENNTINYYFFNPNIEDHE